MNTTYQRCKKCNEIKEISQFHKRKKSKNDRQYHCKECAKKISSTQYKFDPVQNKLDKQTWIANNPHRYKDMYLKKYGLTYVTYLEMLISQGNACAICKIDASKLKKALYVDHCHVTGKVRGLLCNNCNLAIGYLKDNTEYMRNAVSYLEEANRG